MTDPNRTVIRAILETDLERLLGEGSTQRATCLICGRVVPPAEIGGFVKADGSLRLFCDRVTCLGSARSGDWRREPGGAAE